MRISDWSSDVCSSDLLDLVIINSAWCGYACKTPALRPAPPACCANDQIGGKLFGPSCERRDDHQFASAPRVPTPIYRPASSRAAAAGGAIQPAVCVTQIEIQIGRASLRERMCQKL